MRFIHWEYFGSNIISFLDKDNSIYASALLDHFIEYIFYYHTKPVGIPVSDYLSLIFFGSISKGHFLIVSLLDSMAPAFIFIVLLKLKLSRLFSLVIVLIWSFGLISWEYWRWGGHYDHFNVFLFSLYGWSLCRSYNSSNISKNLIFGISSGLLIMFNSFAPLVVLLTLLYYGPRFIFKQKKLFIVKALIPLIVYIIVGGKNYLRFGIPTTSTVSGQNMILFTGIGKGYSAGENGKSKFVNFVNNNKYPAWWVWCFNNSMEHGDQTDVNRFVQSQYGKCCGNIETGYDFHLLEEKLKQLNEDRLLSIIQKDKLSVKEKPWLLHGGVNESNTRFSIEYGKISGMVWNDFLFKEPIEFGKQFIKTLRIYGRGVTFLGENKYEPQHKIRSNAVRIAGYSIGPFFLLGIISAFYLVAVRVINYFSRYEKLIMPIETSNEKILMIMSIILVSYSIILNSITCCENERMFMSISPIALIIGGYYSYYIIYTAKRLNNYFANSFNEIVGNKLQ